MSITPQEYNSAIVDRSKFDDYLNFLKDSGHSKATIDLYSRNIRHFFDYLPENGKITKDTLSEWRQYLLKEKRPQTVNTHMTAVNGYLEFLGLRPFQNKPHIKDEDNEPPSLTRGEYLKLLLTARQLKNRRAYLLIKVFALTGINVSSIHNITVEAVNEGVVRYEFAKKECVHELPEILKKELEDYINDEYIMSGPLFVTNNNVPLSRSTITCIISDLSEPAGLKKGKCTPRCLCKLYQTTQEKLEDNFRKFMKQMNDNLLEREQVEIGWPEH